VGDRVEITSTQMMVDRISLLYTVFTRLDTMQTVQVGPCSQGVLANMANKAL